MSPVNIDYNRPNDGVCWLPPHLRDGMKGYLEHGWTPGDFLIAVLGNDLRAAVGRGDMVSLSFLPHIVIWLSMEAPFDAWGSANEVAEWIADPRWEKAAAT